MKLLVHAQEARKTTKMCLFTEADDVFHEVLCHCFSLRLSVRPSLMYGGGGRVKFTQQT